MTPLVEQAEEYAEPLAEDLRRVVRRAFMAGALAALTSKAPRDQMLAECVQFGRAVGTSAEIARAWGQSERRACEQVQARTGLQVRYDAGCWAQAWDGQWQAISPG